MTCLGANMFANSVSVRAMLALSACLIFTLQNPARGQSRSLALQGMFCNTEAQLDIALQLMGQGFKPRTAASLSNKTEVVCTYVDLLEYVIEHPVEIWQNHSAIAATKYKALLMGVIVGDQLRPISPPAEIFFATPQPIASAVVERPI